TLAGLARQRRYYGRGLLAYHRAHPGALTAQARAVARATWRQRRLLAAEPVVAAGIAAMRAVELAAYLAGAVAGRHDGASQEPAASRSTRSASSASASSDDRSLARTDTVAGPPASPTAPTATADRPLATGKNASRVTPGTSRRPRLDTSSESENRPTTGSSTHPHRGDHT
ncbi:MAG TPA: hypothetical protein VLA80_15325, partial [Actinomycetota bacterium]|nr:hypothetical protein [Actinomycetota bacterium]